ncbi:TPA: phage tail protein [Streptococcus suis]
MLTFLDHKGNEIGALTTFKYTNSVNGERSLSGTVHGNLEIEKGWGVRFEDEYYKVIYAKPKSLGKINIVQFDAVHQFFWDFDKSSVYSELDGSYPFQTFLDHIFNGSGYRYNLEVEVGSLRKQNFGLKKRLELFNDLIKHAGVEFQVRGKVVRILERTGTDLSTVVRKKLNLNDLSIEKRIGDFITYQKGLGAWYDENDHSKGRLEVEYVSPLAAIYGRLEGEPYVDERFTIAKNFLEVLKKTVEDSYSISVQLTMEDLHKAGYRYTRPLAGDYITVIDEDVNFKERVRIVSFESEYDIKGQVIGHTVTCNDVGSVKKQSVGYSSLKSSVANISKETESAIQTANRALVSADGKTTVYFGTEFPQDIPKGTLTKGDTLYLEVGDTTKTYYWNGAEWLEPPVVNDVEAFKENINTEIAQVNQSMQAQSEEHDRQVADILSKTHSVESLANQAKSDVASALARANQVKTEAIADARAQVATVSQALNTAKSELQSAIASADQKARDSQASATALRNDLNLQASKILEQARVQTALTSRVTAVETLADGTRSTVAELSKTVSKATGDIASVTSRTKSVEDTLSQTRTQYEALTQTVNTQTGQIDSINRKTADLQSGIDGVTERFENLQIGGENYLLNSNFSGGNDKWHVLPPINTTSDGRRFVTLPKSLFRMAQRVSVESGKRYLISFYARKRNDFDVDPVVTVKFDNLHNADSTRATVNSTDWRRYTVEFSTFKSGIELLYFLNRNSIEVDISEKIKLEIGDVPTDWSPAEEDLRSEIATYKRTAEESSAELSRQIQLVDGKAVDAKTYAQQTADAIKTRLESLEIYKNAEGDRAEQYLTASREETARQLTAERTAIATNYVAKSIYDENVRGTTLKLNEIKTTADTAKQNQATYQNTVDRKLEELTSSTQTLDGKINTASAKVDTVAGQIRTEISEVEGKIPTENGGTNLIIGSMTRLPTPYQQASLIFTKNQSVQEWQATDAVRVQGTKGSSNSFCYLSTGRSIQNSTSGIRYVHSIYIKNTGAPFQISNNLRKTIDIATGETKRVAIFDVGIGARYLQIVFQQPGTGQLDFYYWHPQIETGTIVNDWSPAPEDLATVTALHNVTDTVDSHTRTIGAVGEAGSILDNVSKVTQTAAGLVQEVSGTNGLKTQVSTLAGSYAIKNLTKAGDVLGQINLNKDGSVKIDGSLVQITGKTYIQDGVITSAKIGKGQIGTAHIGEIDAGIAKIINLDVSNIKGLDAEFIKAKIENALIGWLRGKTISAVNNVTTFDLTTGLITVNNNQSGFLFKNGNSVVGRIGYGNIVRLGTGLSKGINIYTNKNHSLALGYEMTNGMYSTAIQVDGGSGEVRIASPIYLSDKIYPLGTKSYGYLRLDPYGNSGLKLTRNSGNGIAFDDTDVYIIVNGAAYSFKEWVINRR